MHMHRECTVHASHARCAQALEDYTVCFAVLCVLQAAVALPLAIWSPVGAGPPLRYKSPRPAGARNTDESMESAPWGYGFDNNIPIISLGPSLNAVPAMREIRASLG